MAVKKMNENKGAKGGKRERRLRFLFQQLFLKKHLKDEEERLTKEQQMSEKKKKQEIFFSSSKEPLSSRKEQKQVETLQKERSENTQVKKFVSSKLPQEKKKSEVSKDNVKKVKQKEALPSNPAPILSDINISPKEKTKPLEEKSPIRKAKSPSKVILPQEKPRFVPLESEPIETQTVREEEKTVIEIPNIPTKEKISEEETENFKELALERELVRILEQTMKEANYEVKRLMTEEKELEKETQDLLLLKDAEQLSEKVETLLNQLQKLRKELELLEKSSNFDQIYTWDDHYLSYLIDDYKRKYNHGFDLKILRDVQKNEDYVQLMERIIEIENDSKKLEEAVTEHLEEFGERDKAFDLFQKDVDGYDSDFKEIDDLVEKSDEILKDLEEKVKNAVQISEKVEYVTKAIDHSINRLLFTYLATKNNPFVPKTVGLLLRTQAMFAFIGDLFAPRQIKSIKTNVVVQDYTKSIQENIRSLSDVFSLMDETKNKVRFMKEEFIKNFAEYSLLEYQSVLDKLETLEQSIDERHDYLIETEKKMNLQLEKNKVLTKKMENPHAA